MVLKEQLVNFPRRVIIAGPRKGISYVQVEAILDEILRYEEGEVVIVEGGAWGVDRHARTYAESRDIPYYTEEAEWDKLGRSAGHIRNALMGDLANELIAIWNWSSTGTESMIKIGIRKGLKVLVAVAGTENP